MQSFQTMLQRSRSSSCLPCTQTRRALPNFCNAEESWVAESEEPKVVSKDLFVSDADRNFNELDLRKSSRILLQSFAESYRICDSYGWTGIPGVAWMKSLDVMFTSPSLATIFGKIVFGYWVSKSRRIPFSIIRVSWIFYSFQTHSYRSWECTSSLDLVQGSTCNKLWKLVTDSIHSCTLRFAEIHLIRCHDEKEHPVPAN